MVLRNPDIEIVFDQKIKMMDGWILRIEISQTDKLKKKTEILYANVDLTDDMENKDLEGNKKK